LWKAIDLEYFVEHNNAGAQDRGRAGTGVSGSQPLPPLWS
jgi:hypothetical protein